MMSLVVRALVGLAAAMVGGNVAIAAMSVVERRTRPNEPVPPIAGVTYLHPIDAHVWRSSAPSRDAYTVLAERGVRTVVDLRADHGLRDDERFLDGLGVELVRIPIRDGQTPTPAQVERCLDAIGDSPGVTLVHCGAGVGRTGTLAGVYSVRAEESVSADSAEKAPPREALRRNLAVGPPSLEQVWYVARLGHGFAQPPLAVKVVSRILDAPRRIWSRVRHALHAARRASPGR